MLKTSIFILLVAACSGLDEDCFFQYCTCKSETIREKDLLTVTCTQGKLPRENFITDFNSDAERIYIDNSNAETSINDKTKFEPLNKTLFKRYDKLEDLTLSGTFIKTIKDDTFLYSINLKYLDLSYNLIETITSKSFGGLRHLNHLNLNHNRLRLIPSGAFVGLESVVGLSLANNELTDIQSGSFRPNAVLEKLDISYNNLKGDVPLAVYSLKHLDSLVARNCGINVLKENLKDKFSGLITLDLTNNRIPDIHHSQFAELRELKNLLLGGNHINALPSNLFLDLRILNLELNNNRITSIDQTAFQNALITNLNLSHNPNLNLNINTNPKEIFDHITFKQSIRRLSMAEVGLTSVGNLLRFSTQSNLISLDLSNNKLKSISGKDFFDLSSGLSLLNLERNILEEVNDAFFNMKSLKDLNLAGNMLQFDDDNLNLFPTNIFKLAPKLDRLDLSGNAFTFFPDEMVNEFSLRINQLNLKLAGNKLFCNYKTKPLYRFLLLPSQRIRCPEELWKSMPVTNLVTPKCLRCTNLDEKFVIKLNEADLKDPENVDDILLGTEGLIGIIVAAIVLLIIIAVILILLKRRREKELLELEQRDPDDVEWDPENDYMESFEDTQSNFSSKAKAVAHESNI